jgi:hypothetical protein
MLALFPRSAQREIEELILVEEVKAIYNGGIRQQERAKTEE